MALKSWGLLNLVINVTNQLIFALNLQYITKTDEDHLRCFVWLDTSNCCDLSPVTSSLTPPPSELRLQSTNRGHRERNRWLIKEIQQNVYRCRALRLMDLNGLTGDFPAGLHEHERRERNPLFLEPLCCILVWVNFTFPALISTYSRILMFTCMKSRPVLERILCSLVFYQCSNEIANFNILLLPWAYGFEERSPTEIKSSYSAISISRGLLCKVLNHCFTILFYFLHETPLNAERTNIMYCGRTWQCREETP